MKIKTSLVALVSLLALGAAQAQNLIVNGDFESSSVAARDSMYAYLPNWNTPGLAAAGWTFADATGTGIINRSWDGMARNSAVAFLQDHPLFAGAAPMLSQQFVSNGSDFLVSFDVGQRVGFDLQDVVVKLDGITVATGLGAPRGGVTHYNFNVGGITGNNHSLVFTSAHNAGDSTAFLDNVSVVATAFQAAPVPEPASFGLMGLGLAGVGLMRRRQAARA